MHFLFFSTRGTSEDHMARRWARPAHNPRGCAGLNPDGTLAGRPLQYVPMSPGAGPTARSLCSVSDLSTTLKYPLGHRLPPPSSSGNTFSGFSLTFSFPAPQDAGVGVSVPFARAGFPNPASIVPRCLICLWTPHSRLQSQHILAASTHLPPTSTPSTCLSRCPLREWQPPLVHSEPG